MTKMLRFAWTLAGILLLPVSLAMAQQHPNDATGFSPGRTYDMGDVDSVNLFNGNLGVRVPLGQRYPVGPGLDFGLTLVYTSAPWDFDGLVDPVDPSVEWTQASVKPTTAGLGWDLNLGRIVPLRHGEPIDDSPIYMTYESPDGGVHRFYSTLHPDGSVPSPGEVGYTRDGTYLRLRSVNGGFELDFPNGNVHEFDASGRLTWMRGIDPSNYVSICYESCNQPPAVPGWLITDSQGRRHEVHFANGLVQTVKLEKFGGGFAVYQLSYAQDQLINRPCPANYAGDKTVTVDFLTSVLQPDGSSWQPGDGAVSGYETQHPWGSGVGCSYGGLMKRLRLPTRGKVEWAYQLYHFPNDTKRSYFNTSPGVATRTLVDRDGSTLGTWTYLTDLNQMPGTSAEESEELVNTVRAPNGDETKHYFSVYPRTVESNGWRLGDYGLPFTRQFSSNQKFLSTQAYEKVPSGALVLRRSTYVSYDIDEGTVIVLGNNDREDLTNRNRRLKDTRTVYHEEGGGTSAREVSFSGWDGFGHFETEAVSGTFPSGGSRTITVDYEPRSQSWFLDHYVRRSVTEGAETFTELFCFDGAATASPGFLRRHRVLASTNGSLGGTDLLTVYTPDDKSQVVREDFYGGDNATLGTSADLCGLPLPASPKYRRTNGYQHGVLSSSQLQGAGFFDVDRGIDRTGLISSSRDTAQVQTLFEYNSMGRLLWVKPQEGAWTEYAYLTGADGGIPSVIVRQRPNGQPAGTELTYRRWEFDGFGRVREELTRREGVLDRTLTNYDSVGNVTFRSERGGAGQYGTSYEDFDPFGRPRRIRAADCPGSAQSCATDLIYTGERLLQRKVWIGTHESGTAVARTQMTTSEYYDHLGRLWKVEEPIGTVTEYAYDGRDNLRTVKQVAGGTTQNRSFGYDGRGFLLWEKHPEKTTNGFTPVGYPADTHVDYTGYDPFGNPGRVADGDVTRIHQYDSLGRPSQILVERLGIRTFSPTRLVKEFGYGSGTGSGDRSLGKLRMVRRYNYPWNGETEFTAYVTTTSTFGGRGGRISSRATTVNTGPAGGALPVTESYEQAWTWNELGLVEATGYPRCTFPQCSNAQAPVFADVPAGHAYKPEIEAIFDAGLTNGCAQGSYCPDALLTRAEMAIFLLRAAKGSLFQPPACGEQIFADVPCNHPTAPDHWAAAWINEFYRQGYTLGCADNPLRFCPSATVTREEMAAFLLRMAHPPGYTVPSCSSSPFSDVSCGSTLGPAVVQAYNEGLMSACAPGQFCPGDAPNRAQMARILVEAFDIPLLAGNNVNGSRTVLHRYEDGALSEVSKYARIWHHPNGLTRRVLLGKVDAWNQEIVNGMPRPHRIYSDNGLELSFSYDAVGNLTTESTTTGRSVFLYDGSSRITYGRLSHGPYQQFTYDGFGNLTAILGAASAPGRYTPTDPNTNRLSEAAVYTAAGNLFWKFGVQYDYDAFHQMVRVRNSGQDWQYLYDGYDERIAAIRLTPGPRFDRWTLRDLDGKVLRSFEATDYVWGKPKNDYIFRGSRLVATEWPADNKPVGFHLLDHLGTPRVSGLGTPSVNQHHYYPFGEESTTATDGERLKFTGHERDSFETADVNDDLDSMHARTYSPLWGRFLSVDPLPERRPYDNPQKWNRYSYALNSPLVLIDPDGREETSPWWDLTAGIVSLTETGLGISHAPAAVWVTGSEASAAIAAGTTVSTSTVVGLGVLTGAGAYFGTTKVDHGLTKLTGDDLFLEKLLAPGWSHLYEAWRMDQGLAGDTFVVSTDCGGDVPCGEERTTYGPDGQLRQIYRIEGTAPKPGLGRFNDAFMNGQVCLEGICVTPH